MSARRKRVDVGAKESRLTRSSNLSTPGAAIAAVGFLIVACQVAWFAWFESQGLPNANGFPRWMFLARALPQIVIEGLTLNESYIGMALKQLLHYQYLPQRLPILASACLIIAAVMSVGSGILRLLGIRDRLSPGETWIASFGLGAPVLGVMTLIAGRTGILHPWVVRLSLVVLASTEPTLIVRGFLKRPKPILNLREWPRSFAFLPCFCTLLVGPFLAILILGSMLPSIDFDALEYHLQGPKEYYLTGQITFLPHNVYTSMPFNVEMLHLLGMEILDDWWWGALVGQLLIAAHAVGAAVTVAMVLRRLGSERGAWFAATIYLTTPWIYRLGVLPYVEGPLCFYHALLIWAVVRAFQTYEPDDRQRFWVMAGIFAGGAMSCKYPGLISACLPFATIAMIEALRSRHPRVLAAFLIGCGVIVGPWLAKNLIDTGNPVYPLAYRVFGGSHWNAVMDQKWSRAHGPGPVSFQLLWSSILDVVGRSDWQSPLFVAFAPLAFLRREWRVPAMALATYVLYLFLTWWFLTHRLDRFWLPLLPALAMLAGLGCDWSGMRAWRSWVYLVFAILVLGNLSYSMTALTALNEWTQDLHKLRVEIPEQLDPSLAMVDSTLPPNARVLVVGQAAVFHMNHRVLYNTVFDDELLESIAKGRTPHQIHQSLKDLGITHLYIDWFHIERFRSPGNYGYSSWMQPMELARLVRDRVIDPPILIAAKRELYAVRSDSP